jgi:hypothetical protein
MRLTPLNKWKVDSSGFVLFISVHPVKKQHKIDCQLEVQIVVEKLWYKLCESVRSADLWLPQLGRVKLTVSIALGGWHHEYL